MAENLFRRNLLWLYGCLGLWLDAGGLAVVHGKVLIGLVTISYLWALTPIDLQGGWHFGSGSAEAQPADRGGSGRGQSDSAPGRSGEAPGISGDAPGRSGEAPGNSGSAPGRTGKVPGNSASAPGRSGEASRDSANAPGRSGEARGHRSNAPSGPEGVGREARNAPALGEATGRWDAAPLTTGARSPVPLQAAAAPRIRPVFQSGDSDDASSRQNEISVVGLSAANRNALRAAGFSTIASRRSTVLGNRDVSRLRIPPNLSPQEAAAAVRQNFAGVTADLTHLYRPAAQPTSVRYAHELVGVEPSLRCSVNLRIGLIDTGTSRHDALRRSSLVQRGFVDRSAGGNTLHGTAVASLLVGDLPGLEPLVPDARLYSANVFSGHQGTLAADVAAIIEALDWMAGNRTRVVNLSLMGPANELLEQAVLGAARKGVVLVAAGGNDGPSAPPAYPAAYPAVIAVAAVDERGRAYSGNNRGAYIEIAAPGVDIWAAHGGGGEAFWTGTSFAVPFVTAALAREVAAGTVRHIDDARRFLAASARDLGPRGRDPVYGHGLLRARSCR